MTSSLIEGVGDEVTVLITTTFVVVVVTLAWISTRVTEFQQPSQNTGPQETSPPTAEATVTQPQPSTSTESNTTGEDPEPVSSTSTAPQENIPEEAGTSTATTPTSYQPLQPEHSYIKLKFLDDTIKQIQAKPSDTIDHVRRRNFPSANADRYRLIFRGQVLRNGNQTLSDIGILQANSQQTDIPVVHCFLSSEPANVAGSNSATHQLQQAVDELNMGHFFMPLLGSILAILWYLCIFHTTLFTIPSLFGIIGLTCFYVVLVVNQFM